MRITLLALLLTFVTSCGTARTVVIQPSDGLQTFENVQLVAHNPTVEVPPDVTRKIESVIRKGLYDEGPFSVGKELTIQYTFVSHNSGDRLARWFWGGIGSSGEGSVIVLVNYLDPEGNELSRTQVEGRIGSGFFGGSIDEAITCT